MQMFSRLSSFSQVAHGILQGNGNLQLSTLMAVANESGVWTNTTLCHILSNNISDVEKGKGVCCIVAMTLWISKENEWFFQQLELFYMFT